MALPYTYTLNGHHSPSFNLLLNKWMDSIAATTYKPLASLLADKCCTSYGQTMHRVSFSYLRSSIQCIRGAHDSIQWACYTPSFLHRTYSQWICMNTYILLLNTYSHSPISQHLWAMQKVMIPSSLHEKMDKQSQTQGQQFQRLTHWSLYLYSHSTTPLYIEPAKQMEMLIRCQGHQVPAVQQTTGEEGKGVRDRGI